MIFQIVMQNVLFAWYGRATPGISSFWPNRPWKRKCLPNKQNIEIPSSLLPSKNNWPISWLFISLSKIRLNGFSRVQLSTHKLKRWSPFYLSEKWISWFSFFCLARAKNMCFFSVWSRVREMGSVSRPPIPSSVGIHRPALWDNVTCFTSLIFYSFLHKCSFINHLWQRKNISKLTNNFYRYPLSHHPLTISS